MKKQSKNAGQDKARQDVSDQKIPQRTSGRIIAVPKWEVACPEGPPLGTIRHYIFYRESNGFDSVLLRIGGRLFIDEDAYHQWAKSHRILDRGTK